MLGRGRSVTKVGSTVLVAALMIACGGGSDEAAEDSAANTSEPPAEQSTAPDSIPMDVTVTFSGGAAAQGGGEGTYTASGNGSACSHDPAAEAGRTMAEWTVVWGNESAPVGLINLRIGKAGADNSSREMTAMVSAGQVTVPGADAKMPLMFTIGTFPTGAILGRGVARVQRQGEGARVEVDAEDGRGTKMKAVIVCKKLGAV